VIGCMGLVLWCVLWCGSLVFVCPVQSLRSLPGLRYGGLCWVWSRISGFPLRLATSITAPFVLCCVSDGCFLAWVLLGSVLECVGCLCVVGLLCLLGSPVQPSDSIPASVSGFPSPFVCVASATSILHSGMSAIVA